MTYIGDTGQGATVSFTAVDVSDPAINIGCLRSIQLPTWTMDSIDSSCLQDAESQGGWMQAIPADLTDPGETVVVYNFNATEDPVEPHGELYVMSVEFPIGNGDDPGTPNTTPATLQARGFFTSVELPTMESGTLMENTLTFKLDGTGIVYTNEAA